MTPDYGVDIDQCAHCGLVLGEDRFLLLYCADCGFEYCAAHAPADEHECRSVCQSNRELEEGELGAAEA